MVDVDEAEQRVIYTWYTIKEIKTVRFKWQHAGMRKSSRGVAAFCTGLS
jgi:hypothetical protein